MKEGGFKTADGVHLALMIIRQTPRGRKGVFLSTRRFLIVVPVVLSLVLLQSYFWVPTYDEQARGNPGRLEEFINASIGDASILNPILSADSASSEIQNLVFEGLIDRDEDLRFRGRVAESWTVSEEAYFFINPAVMIPGAAGPGAEEVAAHLKTLAARPESLPEPARAAFRNIQEVAAVPARTYAVRRKRAAPGGDAVDLQIEVGAPARIRLSLRQVDQDLFTHLGAVLGPEYLSSFQPRRYVSAMPAIDGPELDALAAELLPATEHNPVIEFRLRPGVKFHDGHALTAKDVQFTYEAIMDPKNLSPRVSDYEPVKEIQVMDTHTVRVVYKRLYSPAVGTWAMGLLPEHLLNEEALRQEALRSGKDPAAFSMRQSEFNRRPVGCGAFVFREWKSDQYIALDRFAEFFEGAPNYKRYLYRIIPDLLTQEMEFYAGTIDAYGVQPYQVARLSDDPRFQHFSGTSYAYSYIGYNMRRPPFDDPRVRRALGMAINVESIIDFVLYRQGERTTGPFLKQTEYYNHAIAPVPYDPQGALRLLAEAGWHPNADGRLEKNGQKLQFTLITNSGNDIRKSILAIAQDAWKQLGIEVRTDLVEWSVFIKERINKLDFDAVVLGWSMGIDPDLYQIWHSSQSGPHQLNFAGYRNPEADDLIVRIRQEYDFDRRVGLCHRLHAIIAGDQPYTFLYVGKWTAVLDKRIVIQETDPGGNQRHRPIQPTRTGNYMFYFNQWTKLAQMPQFVKE
jgi:ABC-type transport system substrate-binding protein